MKKTNVITVILVIVACLASLLIIPTDIGVNVHVNGNAPAVQTNGGNAAEITATVPVQSTNPTVQSTAPAVKGDDDSGKQETPSDSKTKPETVQEIIDEYTVLVNKFKQVKPAYKKKEYQLLPEEYRNFGTGVNVILNVASGYMVTEEECEELVRAAGAQEILTDMPIHNSETGCVLTNYDAVEWAKCDDLGDGTYKLSFSLKEEVNAEPTPADTLVPPSNHGAVMQPMKYSDIKAEVDKVTGTVPGIAVNQFDLTYHECEFSCVYNPETDEVLSITHHIVIDIAADAEVFTANIKGSARLINEMLIYDITW